MPENAETERTPTGGIASHKLELAGGDKSLLLSCSHRDIELTAQGRPCTLRIGGAAHAAISNKAVRIRNDRPAMPPDGTPLTDKKIIERRSRHNDWFAQSNLRIHYVQASDAGGIDAVAVVDAKHNSVDTGGNPQSVDDRAAEPIAVVLFDQIPFDLVGAVP
ncbi:MAG: hypothetical protein BWY83_01107 [bacterium ADurb.Bin478]|nr:MAG: hypothetical protein BWY83_01107 [bacterium ADurb.Bin478]